MRMSELNSDQNEGYQEKGHTFFQDSHINASSLTPGVKKDKERKNKDGGLAEDGDEKPT